MSFVVNLPDVKPGMILAENVFYEKKLLLASGTVMKPSHIEGLKVYGIFRVSVYKQEVHCNKMFSNPGWSRGWSRQRG